MDIEKQKYVGEAGIHAIWDKALKTFFPKSGVLSLEPLKFEVDEEVTNFVAPIDIEEETSIVTSPILYNRFITFVNSDSVGKQVISSDNKNYEYIARVNTGYEHLKYNGVIIIDTQSEIIKNEIQKPVPIGNKLYILYIFPDDNGVQILHWRKYKLI